MNVGVHAMAMDGRLIVGVSLSCNAVYISCDILYWRVNGMEWKKVEFRMR